MDFELETEFITLSQLLKVTGIAESGGMAKQMIEQEEVLFNGVIDRRKGLKVRKGDRVEVHDLTINII